MDSQTQINHTRSMRKNTQYKNEMRKLKASNLKRKKQNRLDAKFKKYIREKHPETYIETVEYTNKGDERMIQKFRKKPIVIEAIQLTGKRETIVDIHKFMNSDEIHMTLPSGEVKIQTLEGVMTANVGDWIIKGIKGEFYPVKNEIFEQTYEKVTK